MRSFRRWSDGPSFLTHREPVAVEGAPGALGAQPHSRHGRSARLAPGAAWRELRPAARRDPRHRRAARLGTHRDSRIDLRRRPRLAERRHRYRRRAGRDRLAGGGLPARRRAGDRRPKGARTAPRFDGARQYRPSPRSARCRASAFAPSPARQRSQPTWSNDLSVRCNDLDQIVSSSVGRQPAEGRHRQVARHRAARPPARRADPRDRRRRQAGDLPARFRSSRRAGSASWW